MRAIMDKPFRILLVSPISDYKMNILPVWLNYVHSLVKSYNSRTVSLDVLLCDNSQNQSFHKQISREYNFNTTWTNPLFKNSRQFICESRNRGREAFLNSNRWNYLLSLECDIFPHEHFLSELIAHRKKLISFPYFIGTADQSTPMINVLDTDESQPFNTRQLSTQEFFLASGRLVPVFNAGLGCTLIHKSIVAKIPFRWDPENHLHDDSFFAEDLYRKNIAWYCDFTSITRHLNIPWNYFPNHKF